MFKVIALGAIFVPAMATAATFDAFMVHGPAFHKTGVDYDIISARDTDGVHYVKPGRYHSIDSYAPVFIRDEATIFQFTCTYRLDGSSSDNIYIGIELLRVQKATSLTDVIAKIDYGGASNRWETEWVIPAADNVVDNENYTYLVKLNMKNCLDGFCRLRNCRTSYVF